MSNNITQTCRDIDELSQTAKVACLLLFQECYKEGIAIFVTETYRSQSRQNYLYEQGRTRSGKVVTWTKNSRHTSRLAWDIAASTLNGNKDIYNISIIKKAGAIAMKLGITWGGQPSWIKAGATDYPHFEVKPDWKIPNGYKLEGKVSIPTSSNKPITIVGSINKLPNVKLSADDKSNPTKLDTNKEVDEIMLNETGRIEARTLIKRAVKEGLFDSKFHTDARIDKYSDGELLSYSLAYINRKIK